MSNIVASSYVGNGGHTTWLRNGGSTIDGVISDRSDATWDFAGGETPTQYEMTLDTQSNDFGATNATTLWFNIKMRRIAVPDTGFTSGTTLTIRVVESGGTFVDISVNVISLLNGTSSGGSFVWYSIHPPTDWQASGGTGNRIRMNFTGGSGNACELDVAEINFGNVSEVAQAYTQAGAASVTMTGSAAEPTNKLKSGGASVTMTGSLSENETHHQSGAASVTMTGSSTQGSTLFTVVGTGSIVLADVHTVNFIPGQGQRVGNVTIDGIDLGVILTYTFSDDAVNHSIVVTFVLQTTGASTYDLGFYQQGMNREDVGGPNPVESHPEKNAANQPGPKGFVPQIRHFVPFPKDFI